MERDGGQEDKQSGGGKSLEVSALQQRLTELSLTDASNMASKQKVRRLQYLRKLIMNLGIAAP